MFKSSQAFVGLVLGLKILLWPGVMIIFGVFLFTLTNVPFGVDDTTIISNAFLVSVKLFLLSMGASSEMFGIPMEIAPMAISLLIYCLSFNFNKKHNAIVNFFTVIWAYLVYLVIATVLALIDGSFQFNGPLIVSLLKTSVFGAIVIFIPWLLTSPQVQKFFESPFRSRLIHLLVNIVHSIVQFFLFCLGVGLILIILALILNWNKFILSFQLLESDWLQIMGLILVNLLFIPNLLLLNFNQVASFFDMVNICPNPQICLPAAIEGSWSLPFMDLIFPQNLHWLSIITGLCFAVIGWYFMAGWQARNQDLFDNKIRWLAMSVILLGSGAILAGLRNFAGVHIGAHYFSGLWSEILLVELGLIAGMCGYELFQIVGPKLTELIARRSVIDN
jgi:hypothetical protein